MLSSIFDWNFIWICFIDQVHPLHFWHIYRFEDIITCILLVVLRKPFAIIFDLFVGLHHYIPVKLHKIVLYSANDTFDFFFFFW